MTRIEMLRDVRSLLSDPERWTKGSFARDEGSCMVEPHDPKAVCWCPGGAAMRSGLSELVADELALALGFLAGDDAAYTSLARWNDLRDRTHAQVLARLDGAIADLAKETT